jgi:glycosyltransferase involved in cell wall biosynthesis
MNLHRWCQWISGYHPGGVYDGEEGKVADFSDSLPPYLTDVVRSHAQEGGRAVILAEEWQTADAVLHLDDVLRRGGLRDRVSLLWNANNVFGFDRIQWDSLAKAARITTVSRYMKYQMRNHGVEALVIPNGLGAEAFAPPDRSAVAELRRRFRGRTLLMKMARWDPDKRWLGAIDITAEAKRQGWRPLLIARGGAESHGAEVLRAARAQKLRVVDRQAKGTGVRDMLELLRDVDAADIVNLRSHVDPDGRRMLFRGVDAVLANSSHEPFGLVGLETMAAGGIACTGCSGEDYAVAGQNALVLETGNPHEFLSMFRRLRSDPSGMQALRRAARSTAKRYAWSQVVQQVFLPRLEHLQAVA